MKTLILAAFAALSLTAAIAPVAANAASFGEPQSSIYQHHGPYDDTGAGSHFQYGGGDGAG